jgi:peptidoglycan DL-endopeptidase CwlO
VTVRFARGVALVAVVTSSLALAVPAPAAGPTPSTTPAPAPTPTPTTIDPRATGARAAFAPKAPGALPRPIISRGVVGDPLAVLSADLLQKAAAGQAGPALDEARTKVAALVAGRLTTATAAELDAAWARTTPVRLKVVLTALSQIGVRYQWASASPADGFDCSGLVLYAWAGAGVTLPHQSEDQIAAVRPVTQAQLQPGDITHYPGHVGLYLGAGKAIVHAVQTGVPVQVDDWSSASRTFGSPLPA